MARPLKTLAFSVALVAQAGVCRAHAAQEAPPPRPSQSQKAPAPRPSSELVQPLRKPALKKPELPPDARLDASAGFFI